MGSTEVVMRTIYLVVLLTWFPITHHDYPRIRHLQKASPEHYQRWIDAREELGISSLVETA